jgi:hypothetical protein
MVHESGGNYKPKETTAIFRWSPGPLFRRIPAPAMRVPLAMICSTGDSVYHVSSTGPRAGD